MLFFIDGVSGMAAFIFKRPEHKNCQLNYVCPGCWAGEEKTHSFPTACNELILQLLKHTIWQQLLVWEDVFMFTGVSLMTNLLICGYLGKDPAFSQFLLHLHIPSENLICSNNTTPTRRLYNGIFLLFHGFYKLQLRTIQEDASSFPTVWRLFLGDFGHFCVSCSDASHYPIAQSSSTAWYLKLRNLPLPIIRKTHDHILSESTMLSLFFAQHSS